MADGRQSRPKSAGDLIASLGDPMVAPEPSGPELRLDDLILFDTAGNDPVAIQAIVFTDEGIGVVRRPDSGPRVLPWSAVSAHVVERWAGGVVPGWWMAPQPRPDSANSREDRDRPEVDGRSLPKADPGAVIAIQTPFGTYRFLRPGADATELSNRITDFAVRHQGLSGVPSVTLVARPRRGNDRRQGSRSRPAASRWARARPYLVVALVVFIVAAVVIILLQSAGAIHLPYLGGAGPGRIAPFTIR
ncbi:MAG: hypothetical protein ACRDYE_08530 [Acidimicrobiales bacterium]